MQNMERLCMLVLAVCLCFLFGLPVQGESVEEDIGVAPGHNQAYAIAVYEKYLLQILPDYEADAYLDWNTMVICVTDEAQIAAIQEALPKTVVESGILAFEVQKYSALELKAVMDFLTPYMPEYSISAVGLDIKGNKIDVHIRDENSREAVLRLLEERGFEPDIVSIIYTKPVEIKPAVYEMKPSDYEINLNASPRTYVVLIGTVVMLIAEYSIFGWLEWRENARYRRR